MDYDDDDENSLTSILREHGKIVFPSEARDTARRDIVKEGITKRDRLSLLSNWPDDDLQLFLEEYLPIMTSREDFYEREILSLGSEVKKWIGEMINIVGKERKIKVENNGKEGEYTGLNFYLGEVPKELEDKLKQSKIPAQDLGDGLWRFGGKDSHTGKNMFITYVLPRSTEENEDWKYGQLENIGFEVKPVNRDLPSEFRNVIEPLVKKSLRSEGITDYGPIMFEEHVLANDAYAVHLLQEPSAKTFRDIGETVKNILAGVVITDENEEDLHESHRTQFVASPYKMKMNSKALEYIADNIGNLSTQDEGLTEFKEYNISVGPHYTGVSIKDLGINLLIIEEPLVRDNFRSDKESFLLTARAGGQTYQRGQTSSGSIYASKKLQTKIDKRNQE